MLIGTTAAAGLWETGFNVPKVQKSFEVRCEASRLSFPFYSISLSLRATWAEGKGKVKVSGNELDVIFMRGSSLLHTHSDSHTQQVELSKAWLTLCSFFFFFN